MGISLWRRQGAKDRLVFDGYLIQEDCNDPGQVAKGVAGSLITSETAIDQCVGDATILVRVHAKKPPSPFGRGLG